MAGTEKRLSRWSRLKSKGGADEREETAVVDDKVKTEIAVKEAEPAAKRLPGGVMVRNFVPAMAPLAPDPEDDDDELTRGIGHAEPDPDVEIDENAEPAGPRVLGDVEVFDTDAVFAGIEEEDLTDEQQEIVAGLPPVESLVEGSDFTPFLKDGVPEFMKRKALRMLWRASPFFNLRDGLNDYDEDFNIIDKVIDEMVGNYKVGRGHLSEEELRDMMPEEARRAFDEDEEEAEDGEDTALEDADEGELANAEVTDADLNQDEAATKQATLEDDDDDDDVGDGEDDPNL
ncbi:DUF3306 domain-containing protein [Rhodospirillales bacterium]|nr:DUF3306 domain-containing protein [Rhodospirillales bacterium]